MLDTSTSPGAASDEMRAPSDDRDPGDLLSDELALTCVDPGAHLQTELVRGLHDVPRTRDRPRGAVETAEEPVPGGVDLLTAVAGELPTNVDLVAREKIPPSPVT